MLAVHGTTGTLIGTYESFAKTSFGYSGEHFDGTSQTQYLRARSYDPLNGRITGLDPFAGNLQDPHILHKYAYVHGDPIQGIDPTGESSLVATIGSIAINFAGAALSTGGLVAGAEAFRHLEKNFAFGNGGRDITPQINKYFQLYKDQWATKTLAEKQAILNFAYSPTTAAAGWDTDVLTDAEDQRVFTQGVPDATPRTVTYSDKVYYAHELNYLLWGLANGIAYTDSSLPNSNDYFISTTLQYTARWRILGGPLYLLRGAPHGGTLRARQAWARAGWNWAVTGILSPPTDEALPRSLANAQLSTYGLEARVGEFSAGGPPTAMPLANQIQFQASP